MESELRESSVCGDYGDFLKYYFMTMTFNLISQCMYMEFDIIFGGGGQ